jgi:3-deoxy-D-manno-octulosonate 8-phosphate phosphatase KdsC-like HAD superfamily phosphatase
MASLEKILKENAFKAFETECICDDVIADGRTFSAPYGCLQRSKKYVDCVSALGSGKCVVREVIELIAKTKGKRKKSLDRYIST